MRREILISRRSRSRKRLDEMKQKNFIPFKAGIDAGADFVMVGHGDVSAADTSAEYMPACLSKKMVTDELRGELGFNGIVITDAMNMEAISDYFGADEAAVKGSSGRRRYDTDAGGL
jgi:beta-N-acetylhexosaminidase